MLTISIPEHISESFEAVVFLEPTDSELQTIKKQLTLIFDSTGKEVPFIPL
jgi:hypothetical protein